MPRPYRSAALGLALLASLLGCGPSGTGPADSGGPSDGSAGTDAAQGDAAPDAGPDGAQEDAAADAPGQQDVAPQRDAQTDTLPAFGCANLLINEIQPFGANEGDEFIEIAGPPGGDLSAVKLVYREAAGTSDISLWAFNTGDVVPVTGHIVIASNSWAGGTPAAPGGSYLGNTTGKLTSSGGGLALRRGSPNSGTILDSVGWGNATNAFVQGTPTAAPPAGKSSSRSPRCQSTGNNAADFSWTNPSPGH